MTGSIDMSFSLQKKEITRKHRQECVSIVEMIYREDPVMDGDLIFINFFALVTSNQNSAHSLWSCILLIIYTYLCIYRMVNLQIFSMYSLDEVCCVKFYCKLYIIRT